VKEAQYGAGAFAWATGMGVQMLLRDKDFEKYLKKYSFHLIVGTDTTTTTTPAAIAALRKAQSELKGLQVQIFVTREDDPLFHLKMAWFRNIDGGSLVIGSGNLTRGGLRRHWEAYAHCQLDKSEVSRTADLWKQWVARNADRLFEADAPEVARKVEQNLRDIGSRRKSVVVTEGVVQPHSTQVLLAQLSKSGDRWKQANFHKEHYEEFFGARVGTQRRMLFRWLPKGGELAEVESRPSVEVGSRNWRFELSAS